VPRGSRLDGKTLGSSGICTQPGIQLIQLRRPLDRHQHDGDDDAIGAVADGGESGGGARGGSGGGVNADGSGKKYHYVSPSVTTVVRTFDELFFRGPIEVIKDVYRISGVVPSAAKQYRKLDVACSARILAECTLGTASRLIGRSVSAAHLRRRHGAVAIAVARPSRRGAVDGRLLVPTADVTLQAGDTLLVETSLKFVQHHSGDTRHFALVCRVGSTKDGAAAMVGPNVVQSVMAMLLAVAAIGVSAADSNTTLLASGLVCALLYVAIGVLSTSQFYAAMRADVLLLIAAAFALGEALKGSGAAAAVAGSLVGLFRPLGAVGVLFGLYAACATLSAFISNTAAVALLFPIARQLVGTEGLGPKALMYTLMLAGSASFSTPISYQTNLMVWQPGHYQFVDFVYFGAPLQLVVGIASVGLTYLLWHVIGL